MIGYPFDSHVTFESDGTPVYDRAITSAPLRKLYKKLFSDGVMPNPSTNMQVSAGTGMNVIVSPGFAMCNGCMKLEESQRTLAVQASSAMYDRIDTVVLRLNDNDSERICDFYIVEGTPAVSPVRPELTKTESIWELGLADLFVAKNSTEISNQRITDTRYETARCGIVSSVSEFDTETLYQQIQADLAGFKAEEQAEFLAWFEEIKGQLSEDAAGNLQTQIGSLPSLVTEVKDSLVSAINWVVAKLNAVKAMLGEKDISSIGDGTVTGAIATQNETFTNRIDELNTNLTADDIPFRFGKDAEGNFGYILTDETGADSVIPFNNFDNLELLSSGANGATSPTVINSTVSKSLTATKKGVMIAAVGGGSGASTVIGGLCYKNNVKISPTIQAPSCAPLQAWLIPVNEGDVISISAVGSGSSTTYTSYPMMSCIIGFLA